jgi:hypothetical protein
MTRRDKEQRPPRSSSRLFSFLCGSVPCYRANHPRNTIGTHLCPDVLKTGRTDEAKGDEEYVGLGIRERPETVVIFLASGIPQAEVDRLAVDHDICGVVVEDCGDVLALETRQRGGVRTQRTERNEKDRKLTGNAF